MSTPCVFRTILMFTDLAEDEEGSVCMISASTAGVDLDSDIYTESCMKSRETNLERQDLNNML